MHQSRPRNKRKPESPRSKSASGNYNTGNMQAFDPGQNVHLWTMWRIAVTEHVIKNTKLQQRLRSEGRKTKKPDTLTSPPLSQYIHVTAATHARANAMMGPWDNASSSDLLTKQFIYYGLPRVNIRPDNASAVSHHPPY